MISASAITPILADLGMGSFFVLIAVLWVGLPGFLAFMFAIFGKACGRKWRRPTQLFTSVSLVLVLAWWIFMNVRDEATTGFKGMSAGDFLEFLTIVGFPLILLPYARWLWRWIDKDKNDGVFR